ncbi:HAMP domain-containing histidine kinase [Flavobacteriales bacterium]|nr:HAMP domain-containing histidine kinase [Flavobacteriales bacterium]
MNNMTHELKTPISTISLSTDVLLQNKENKKNERLYRYLSIIKTENKRLENQVERVLQIAKLDKNKIDLVFEKIDLHEIINTCTNTFNIPILERQGKIEKDLSATKTIILGDIIHVKNIIYNLFVNANKYSPNTPKINVKTLNLNNEINVIISDEGIGIKKEDQKEIFNKFYRVSTGDVHNVKGYGLGLYYVKEMMLKHRGGINIKSTNKKGSQFILTFPLDINK